MYRLNGVNYLKDMGAPYKDIDEHKLLELAEEYCQECADMTKEVPTARGAVKIKERNLPTIKYFILHWLKKKDFNFYTRQHVYRAMEDESHPLCDTLKNIRNQFDAMAEDVVANEQKGIFYAKNRLGMTDKQESKSDNIQRIVVEYSQDHITPTTPGTGADTPGAEAV